MTNVCFDIWLLYTSLCIIGRIHRRPFRSFAREFVNERRRRVTRSWRTQQVSAAGNHARDAGRRLSIGNTFSVNDVGAIIFYPLSIGTRSHSFPRHLLSTLRAHFAWTKQQLSFTQNRHFFNRFCVARIYRQRIHKIISGVNNTIKLTPVKHIPFIWLIIFTRGVPFLDRAEKVFSTYALIFRKSKLSTFIT